MPENYINYILIKCSVNVIMFGHVERMEEERMNKQIYDVKVVGCMNVEYD